MYYNLDNEGNLISCGILPEFGDIAQGNEPFSFNNFFEYKKDLTTGEWIKIETLDYPHAGRNIRVELTDAQITYIILNEQTRPLMEWAYHVPNRKTGNGLILWFVDFINTLMSEQDTEFLLKSLGAIITRKLW